MACKKYIYAAGDTTWVTTFMEAVERSWKGMNNISLTNYDTPAACSIAEGSVFEVAGSLYIATSDSAIGTAGISTAVQYIQAIGSTGGCVFAYNAVAPTWRNDYQGYYASAASTTRVIGGCYYYGTSYISKWICKPKGQLMTTEIEIGDWNMNSSLTSSILVRHGFDNNNIRHVKAIVRDDDNLLCYALDKITGVTDGTMSGSIQSMSTTTMTLSRVEGKFFDNTTYNSTAYNRGWVTIWFKI